MSKKYTVLEYGLSVFMSQIQRRITAVTLFPTLLTRVDGTIPGGNKGEYAGR